MDKELLTRIKSDIINQLDTSKEISEEELLGTINITLRRYSREMLFTIDERRRYVKELYNSIRRLDFLEELLENPEVTEIMINGYKKVFVEKKGRIFAYDKAFESKERLEDIVQQIAARSNRIVNETTPILDTRLKDGSRVNIVLAPISIEGPTVTIRKFYEVPFTLEDMVRIGSISESVSRFLKELVRNRINIFISGSTGSGKTTFLNALSQFIPSDERIITIEDSAELKLQDIPNLVRLEARNANVEGKNAIGIRDLIRSALRMRPDRIIIGEVRGEETIDLLQALNTGHAGSLSTGHSNSAKDMLTRLETMFLMGMELPLVAIKGQIASAIEVIVHLKRYKDGSRKVEEIMEIVGMDNGEISTNRIFGWESDTKKQSELRVQNLPVTERIRAIYEEIYGEKLADSKCIASQCINATDN